MTDDGSRLKHNTSKATMAGGIVLVAIFVAQGIDASGRCFGFFPLGLWLYGISLSLFAAGVILGFVGWRTNDARLERTFNLLTIATYGLGIAIIWVTLGYEFIFWTWGGAHGTC